MTEKYIYTGVCLKNLYEDIKKLLIQGIPCKIKVSSIRGTKTNLQLGYYYGVIIPAYKKFFKESGLNENQETIDIWIKKLSGFVDRKIDPINGGADWHVTSKSKMTSREMSNLIETSLRWADEQGFYIPPAPSSLEDLKFSIDGGVIRNDKYLAALINKFCMFCGSTVNVQPHHIRLGSYTGISDKPSDNLCIPLCVIHHKMVHDLGEDKVYNKYKEFFNGMSPQQYAANLYDKWKSSIT